MCYTFVVSEEKMKDLKYYFEKGMKNGFALGAFNFNNLESLKGIVDGANKTNSPCIIAVSEGAFEYMGGDYIVGMVTAAKKTSKVPLFLHLDHGKSFEMCKKAIECGFDSVMIDGSSLPFKENISLTKKVCTYAHKKNVYVEGELGRLQGVEDNVSSDRTIYTNPEEAYEFATKTGVDSLAIAIGTSHGAYKYTGKQTLRIDILEEVEKLLPNLPIVLHGASTVNPLLVEKINKNGGKIKKAIGINEDMIREAVKKHNVVKINSDTDLRLAMTGSIREVFKAKPDEFDPRKYIGIGQKAIASIVADKCENLLFSKNRA